jgi:hypothetical protein
MADFVLVILTVVTVGVGGFHLGRLSMRDRYQFLLRELDEVVAWQTEHIRERGTHPGLRVVKETQ